MLSKGGGANIRYLEGNEGYARPEYIRLLSPTQPYEDSAPDFIFKNVNFTWKTNSNKIAKKLFDVSSTFAI